MPFPHTKSFPFTESFTLCPQKPLVFATKTPLVRTTFYCPQKPPFHVQKPFFCTNLSLLVSKTARFHKPKALLLHKSFLNCYPKQSFSALRCPFQPPLTYCPQKISIFTNQKPCFCTNFFLFPPKTTLFPPPPPISTSLNLLSTKNTAVLLMSALILCCKAGASHRFKSLPAIPGKPTIFTITGYLMNAGHFSKNHVSTGDLNRPRSPEVRKPLACFLILFARRKKNVKTSPSQGVPRFSKPRISTLEPQLRTTTIKTFLRKLRGSANLESAHRSRSFVQTN